MIPPCFYCIQLSSFAQYTSENLKKKCFPLLNDVRIEFRRTGSFAPRSAGWILSSSSWLCVRLELSEVCLLLCDSLWSVCCHVTSVHNDIRSPSVCEVRGGRWCHRCQTWPPRSAAIFNVSWQTQLVHWAALLTDKHHQSLMTKLRQTFWLVWGNDAAVQVWQNLVLLVSSACHIEGLRLTFLPPFLVCVVLFFKGAVFL